MAHTALTVVASAAAVTSAAAGGVMFAFSTFVMPGLDRAGSEAATAAMRSINAEAKSSALFLLLYFGAALLSIAVGVLCRGAPGAWWLLAGAVLGVLGAAVTMAANVPLNDRLATGALTWQSYSGSWTAWNHVRTATGLAAAALMAVGLAQR